VSGAQLAVRKQMLDRGRQPEQPQGVADRRPALAHAVGDLLMRQLEVVDQLPEGGGLLERSQVLPMEVLDQRLLHDGEVVGSPHQGGNRRQPGAAGRSPPPLAGDQLVAGGRLGGANQHRLQDTELLDACGQFGQRLFVEVHARLVRVRSDVADGDIDQDRGVVAARRCRLTGRDERAQPLAETATPRHDAPPVPRLDMRSPLATVDRK
jgi:hypothetical protein